MKAQTCSGCNFFVNPYGFGGECYKSLKSTPKWLKSHCDDYKPRAFKQRPPEMVGVESL